MVYSATELGKVKLRIIQMINEELDIANYNNCLENVLEKYGIEIEQDNVLINTNAMKILVIGSLDCNVNHCLMAAKKMNVSSNNIEFESDYLKLKRFGGDNLMYSTKYSDIIVGPMPHSMEGKGDYSSLIARIKANPTCYPKLIEATANCKHKITKNSFSEALKKTTYYKEINKFACFNNINE